MGYLRVVICAGLRTFYILPKNKRGFGPHVCLNRADPADCAVANCSMCLSSLSGCDQCDASLYSHVDSGITTCVPRCPQRYYINGPACAGNTRPWLCSLTVGSLYGELPELHGWPELPDVCGRVRLVAGPLLSDLPGWLLLQQLRLSRHVCTMTFADIIFLHSCF